MTTVLKSEDRKESNVSIPTICVENICGVESSMRGSPTCITNLPNFILDNDIVFENSPPLNIQISQFFCWFSELTASKQFLFAVLVLQNISSEYVNITHTLLSKRIPVTSQYNFVGSRANDIDNLSQIATQNNPSDLTSTLVDLLPHVKPQHESNEQNTKLHDVYLDLVDKAFEQALHKTTPAPPLHRQAMSDDVFETPEGQLVLFSLSTPLFKSDDKTWLTTRLIQHYFSSQSTIPTDADCNLTFSDEGRSQGTVAESAQNLINLARDLLDAFSIGSTCSDSCPPKSGPRQFRSSSFNMPFPFFPRTLLPCGVNRRHHSLVPSTSSLGVPPSLSNTSSGFISGSESIQQDISQVGLNETQRCSVYGSRLTPLPPSHSRLYPSLSLSFNPFRRQSASPYTFHPNVDGQLKEGDETAFYISESNQSPEKSPNKVSPSLQDDMSLAVGNERARIPQLMMPYLEKDNISSLRGKRMSLEVPSNLSPVSPYTSASIPRLSITSQSPTPSPSEATGATAGSFFIFDEGAKSPTSACCQLAVNVHRPSGAGGFSGSETSLWSPQPSPCGRHGLGETVQSNMQLPCERDNPPQDLGMAYVPVWLKSLRLHKYVGLFQRLTYTEMLGITDEWLQRQHVTQGARNKILVSINNLANRGHTLKRLEARLLSCITSLDCVSVLRSCLIELRGILQTPLPPFTVTYPSPLQDRQNPSSTSSAAGENSAHPVAILDEEDDLFILTNEEEDEEGGAGISEDEFGDDEEEEFDLAAPHRQLCQCSFAKSDTCLAVAASDDTIPSVVAGSSADGDEDDERKRMTACACDGRAQSTEGVCRILRRQSDLPVASEMIAASNLRPRGATTSPQPPPLAFPQLPVKLHKENMGDVSENLPDLIIKCLLQVFKLLMAGSKENQDNYGAFTQLLSLVLDHSAFTAEQKKQLADWQRQLLEALGPAPPRRAFRNTRPSRRPSHFSSSSGLQHHQMQHQHGGSSGGLPFRGVPRHPFAPRVPRFQNLPILLLAPPPHQQQNHSASLSPIRHCSTAPVCSFLTRASSPQPYTVQSKVYQRSQSGQQGASDGVFMESVPNFLQPQSWASYSHQVPSRGDYPAGYLPVQSSSHQSSSMCEVSGGGEGSAFHPWATTPKPQQQHDLSHAVDYHYSSYRVVSMDSLPFQVDSGGVSGIQPHLTQGPCSMFPHSHLGPGLGDRGESRIDQTVTAFQRNRMPSYHGPIREGGGNANFGGGYLSHQSSEEVSELTSASLVPIVPCCQQQNLFPIYPAFRGGDGGLVKQASIDMHNPCAGTIQESAAATAEINHNLDLLTQNVTKLAIEESDSSNE